MSNDYTDSYSPYMPIPISVHRFIFHFTCAVDSGCSAHLMMVSDADRTQLWVSFIIIFPLVTEIPQDSVFCNILSVTVLILCSSYAIFIPSL